MFVCATKAASHGASKKHNELSAWLSLHLQWRISPPTSSAVMQPPCCCFSNLPQPGLGKSEGLIVPSHAGSTCSQTGWHSYQSLIFKLNIFTCLHRFWFFYRRYLVIKQRRLLRNRSIKTCKSDYRRCPKYNTDTSARRDQHSNSKTGNINRISGISLDYRLLA